MINDLTSVANVLIITLLIANLGLSAYIAFRLLPARKTGSSKDTTTTAVPASEANKLAEAIIPLYNEKNISAFYDRFDQLAKVQFTKEQLTAQIEKLSAIFGRIEGCAYSHATIADAQGGRTYYTLHHIVNLSSGSFSTGNLTLTVIRNADGLGLLGFFINGTSGQRSL